MKKEYTKPTIRSHELRCSSMIAQSLQTKTIQVMRRGSGSDSSSSSDFNGDDSGMGAYDMPEYAD